MKCARDRCRAEATHVPNLRIPAKGHKIAEHTPLSMLLNVPMCLAHTRSAKASEFVIEETRQAVRDLLGTIHMAEPDFGRMYLEPIAMDSAQYGQLQSMSETKQ